MWFGHLSLLITAVWHQKEIRVIRRPMQILDMSLLIANGDDSQIAGPSYCKVWTLRVSNLQSTRQSGAGSVTRPLLSGCNYSSTSNKTG